MLEIFTPLIAGPVLPATVLLGFLVCWSLLALLGATDFELNGPGSEFEIGSSIDAPSATDAISGLGIATMRWLNLREIPLMVWLGIFVIVFWLVSVNLWIFVDTHFVEAPGFLLSGLLVVRSLAIAVPVTKLITQPMRHWFTNEKFNSKSLIGQECEISSMEASPEFGQVRFKTDGSPLLLNVRTDGAHLAKGERVWITHYDPARRIYIVSPTTTNSSSVSDSSSIERE